MKSRLHTHRRRSGFTVHLGLCGLILGLMATSTMARPIAQYRVDPLTESWRWNRVDTIPAVELPLLQSDQRGNLHVVGRENQLIIFDGISSIEIPLHENLSSPAINGFFRTSRGDYCIIDGKSIKLYDGENWSKVSDHGLSRRAYRNILETEDGILFAGTDNGIVRIDPLTGDANLIPYPHPILSISKSPDGESIWISVGPSGMVWECPLLPGKQVAPRSSWILRRPAMPQVIPRASLFRASDDRVWYINSNYTLPPSVYDPEEDAWTDIDLVAIGGDHLSFSILETQNGTIFISSRGSLSAFRNGDWKVYRSPHYPIPGASSLLAEDPDGFLYITEAGGTILRIDYAQQKGQSFENLHYQATSEQNDLIFISSEDEVLVLQAGATEATVYSPETTGVSTPVALRVVRNGDYFLVGEHRGKAAVSIFDGARWTPQKIPRFARFIGHLGILERRNGEIWMGSGHDQEQVPDFAGGILIFTPRSGGYDITHLQPPAVEFRNWSIEEGPDGMIYTNDHGIYAVTPTGTSPIGIPERDQGKWIDQIATTDDGDLWLALWTVGVLRRQDGVWTRFFDGDGMGSPRASFILSLDGKNPVVATQDGIYRFDGRSWAPFMKALGGLHRDSGQLIEGAGRSVWMNHTHVDWYYRGQRDSSYPDEKKEGFRTVQYLPTLDPPQTYWVEKPPSIIRETSLRVRYAGRDTWSTTSPDSLQFSYRINGGNWSPFGPARELELERLTGGNHILEIMARDTDFNVEISPLTAEFRVIIPVWKQAWFLPTVIAFIVLVIALGALFIRQRVLLLLKVEQVKMNFFTHLSHEIKTPLSLILGPVEKLQNEITDSTHQHSLWLIKANSQRLLYLVNQLLDFRKFQLKKLEFKAEKGDFIPFVGSSIPVFQGWAEEKGHDLAFETDLESLVFAFDQEMFHQIIDNLVNNAVKYTSPGGRIRVRVGKITGRNSEVCGLLEVEDQGPGIPESEKESIFEPFYRNPALSELEEGSGIGLAFVKELTTAVQGRIEVVSPVNPQSRQHPGSCFRIIFPLPLEPSPARKDSPEGFSGQETAAPGSPEPPRNAERKNQPLAERDLVLLIEDNHDLRNFLADELKMRFRVESAESVDEGIRMCRELIPDLVVSDVVMPGKSGFEVCKAIKAHEHTSHIPVILLTALRSEAHKRQAYESGADDFINKPVSSEILRAKIWNLLSTQKNVRERVRHQFVGDNRITGLAERDQEFLDKVESIVEEHLDDDQFEVNVLAQKTGFSRSAFYRKFKSLTDLSPAAYIRTKRLRRAAQLLAQGDKSIIEIAFDVGFSDSSYFGRVFKEEYHCSPSEFARTGKGEANSA